MKVCRHIYQGGGHCGIFIETVFFIIDLILCPHFYLTSFSMFYLDFTYSELNSKNRVSYQYQACYLLST